MQTQIFPDIHIPSVSELTSHIKLLLESEFANIRVEGEVSKPVKSASGHLYFTLKDQHAQISCVMWRSQVERSGADLVHGQQIIASGDVQVYPPHGKYQMIVGTLAQAGAGALQLAFERLKNKLEAEGLFDPSRKKSLPVLPQSIGIVTSETGAAFQDIISTLQKRFPMVTVYLYHASVQGITAAGEIANGIRHFSSLQNVDVLIVTRGGGSLEDLWSFNEEVVARAIFECPIPVISAVGHETDFSISDFTADARAATPTQAVILAVPDFNELKIFVDEAGNIISKRLEDFIRRYRDLIDRLIRSHGLMILERKLSFAKNRIETYSTMMDQFLKSRVVNCREKSGNLRNLLEKGITARTQRLSNHFSLAAARLQSMNPDEPLHRGYTRIMQHDKWIRNHRSLGGKDPFEVIWSDGKQLSLPVKDQTDKV
jgi:exodeoxyribonuclease VII large subunit